MHRDIRLGIHCRSADSLMNLPTRRLGDNGHGLYARLYSTPVDYESYTGVRHCDE